MGASSFWSTKVCKYSKALVRMVTPPQSSSLEWLQQGTDYRTLRAEAVVADRLPFSTEKKYMLSVVQHHGSRYLLVKGAPEIVMQMCAVQSEHLKQVLHQYQQQAMRTLAVAR